MASEQLVLDGMPTLDETLEEVLYEGEPYERPVAQQKLGQHAVLFDVLSREYGDDEDDHIVRGYN